jgi:CubicO group peptidase (beta-lactamase class C family)
VAAVGRAPLDGARRSSPHWPAVDPQPGVGMMEARRWTRRTGVFVAALTLAFASGVGLAQTRDPAQTPATDPAARTAQVLDSWVGRTGFIGTVLVARGDEILLHRGIGPADVARGVDNRPGMRYLLASVSKQFTAAAVLRLMDQGKLGLDDPVRRHLPELPAAWARITVRQLLAHTSGIPNHNEGAEFERTKARAWTPRELLASFATRPLDFEPGTRFRYSNSGYIVAGLLIEQISGQPYAAFLEREFFAPLGMADTGVADGRGPVARLATGYRSRPGTSAAQRLQAAADVHMSVPWSAGALFGTARDLLTWQRALHGGRVLSAAAWREMTRVQHDAYALGLGVRGRPEAPVFSHSGDIDGFSSYLLYDSAQGVTVAVLANLEGLALERMASTLADAALGRPLRLPEEIRAVALAPADLEALQGGYERPGRTDTFWVALSGGRLWARLGRDAWRELVPESATTFVAMPIDATVAFERGPDGRGLSARPQVGPPGAPPEPRWMRVDKPLPTLRGQAIHLRGSANAWGTGPTLRDDGSGRLGVEVDWPAGEHAFKLASADWQAVDLGGGDAEVQLVAGADSHPASGRIVLATQGRNLSLRLPVAARCRFELDTRDVVSPSLAWDCRPR